MHQTTISREQKLGWNGSVYDPLLAKTKTNIAKHSHARSLIIDAEAWAVIKQYL